MRYEEAIKEFWNIHAELSMIDRRSISASSIVRSWRRLDRPIVNRGRALALRAHREGDIGLYFSDTHHSCSLNDEGLWFKANVDKYELGHRFTRAEVSELCIQRILHLYNRLKEICAETTRIEELAVIESSLLDMRSALRWFELIQ